MNKLNITIKYHSFSGQKISDFMASLDLGIEEIEPEVFCLTYTTKTKVNKKYKEKMERILREEIGNDFVIKEIKVEEIK